MHWHKRMSECQRNRYLLVVELIIIAAITLGLVLGISAVRGDAWLPTRNWPEAELLPELETAAPVIDCIETAGLSPAEQRLFISLQGLVNKTRPRIWADDSFPSADNQTLAILDLSFAQVQNPYGLLDKYREEIKGVVVYDQNNPYTLHLAAVMAASCRCVIADGQLAERLRADWDLPVVEDLRDRFPDRFAVYQYMLDHFADDMTDRLLIGSDPSHIRYLDYCIAVGAFPLWLDPAVPEEAALLEAFMQRMPAGKSVYLGDWPEATAGITLASRHGLVCLDGADNLSLLSGLPDRQRDDSTEDPAAFPVYQPENKLYIALIAGDGSLREGLEELPALWESSRASTLPLSWNLSPVVRHAAPALYGYFMDTAAEADCFVIPSAALGAYSLSDWQDGQSLIQLFKRTDVYAEQADYAAAFLPGDLPDDMSADARQGVVDLFGENLPHLSGLLDGGGQGAAFSDRLPLLPVRRAGSAEELMEICQDAWSGFDHSAPFYLAVQTPLLSMSDYEGLAAQFPDIVFVTVDDCLALMRGGSQTGEPARLPDAPIRGTGSVAAYDPYDLSGVEEEPGPSPWRYVGAAAISLISIAVVLAKFFLLERARRRREAAADGPPDG